MTKHPNPASLDRNGLLDRLRDIYTVVTSMMNAPLSAGEDVPSPLDTLEAVENLSYINDEAEAPIDEVTVLRGLLIELLVTVEERPDDIGMKSYTVRKALADLESVLRPSAVLAEEDLARKIENATGTAEAVFWSTIAEAFPEIKRGDLDPGASGALVDRMRETVKLWVETNRGLRRARDSKLVELTLRITVGAPIDTGPWDDRLGNVTFTPFFCDGSIGYNIKHGARVEHIVFHPSSGGSSPDVWARLANGPFTSLEASVENATGETFVNVLELEEDEEDAEPGALLSPGAGPIPPPSRAAPHDDPSELGRVVAAMTQEHTNRVAQQERASRTIDKVDKAAGSRVPLSALAVGDNFEVDVPLHAVSRLNPTEWVLVTPPSRWVVTTMFAHKIVASNSAERVVTANFYPGSGMKVTMTEAVELVVPQATSAPMPLETIGKRIPLSKIVVGDRFEVDVLVHAEAGPEYDRSEEVAPPSRWFAIETEHDGVVAMKDDNSLNVRLTNPDLLVTLLAPEDEDEKDAPRGNSTPRYCPACCSRDLVLCVATWPAFSEQDPGNKARLDEHQCRDCALSFWM